MPRTIISLLILFLVPACAQTGGFGDYAPGLSSEERSVREKSVDEIARLGPDVIKPLVEIASGKDRTAAAGARVALRKIVHASRRRAGKGSGPMSRAFSSTRRRDRGTRRSSPCFSASSPLPVGRKTELPFKD